jgi:UPF0755 protein
MKKFLWFIIFLFAIAIVWGGFNYYNWFKKSAVKAGVENLDIYIETGTNIDGLYDILDESQALKSIDGFKKLSAFKGLENPKPGHYVLNYGLSNNQLVNMFMGGLQTPVKIVITPVRTPEALAGKLASYIELDSTTIINALHSNGIAHKYGFDQKSFYTIFIPDTYEVYWNMGLNTLLKRMQKEYNSFWNEKRKAKAEAVDLSPAEVNILASIVLSEQLQHPGERPMIAGLYLNRLKKGMPLQSDPTLIYAIGDFSINRVLNKDKEIDSPYNTYMYAGLPPGPIYLPDKSSIDAVLNADKNRYLYMCAKPDNSGYHAFATNLSQHNRNAKKYQRWISSQGIYR